MSQQNPERFALVVGAMKSGTTTVFELLSKHPEICGSRVKELNYFSSSKYSAQDWEIYLKNWNSSASHSVFLEASPEYTKYPYVKDVPQRIAANPLSDRFRFIYVVRNPIAQIQSHIRHSVYACWESRISHVPEYMLDIASYARQLDQFAAYFSKERFLVFPLEEFMQKPESVLLRLTNFLSVDSSFRFEGIDRAYNTGDFFGAPSVIRYAARSRAIRTIAGKFLPRALHHRLRSALGRTAALANGRELFKLSAGQIGYLRDVLAPDVKRLHFDYGVDTSYWAEFQKSR